MNTPSQDSSTGPLSPDDSSHKQNQSLETELELLPELIKASFTTWKHGAKPFQLEAIRAQVQQTDVLLHAATGSGKTGIAAGPHLLPSSKGKVTIMVSPLLALQEEQVLTFEAEFKLRAIALNSSTTDSFQPSVKEILAGKYQIVIVSPEMLLSRRFIDSVLRKPGFGTRVLSVFIDEAHCISHWGDSFRKKYSSIAIIRAFLPKSTPFIAVSATLTPPVRRDIISKLQFNPKAYLFINIGNDRPNVAQVVRAAEYPMVSCRDLDFLIPLALVHPNSIPKTLIYSDDIKAGAAITDHLNTLAGPTFADYGVIRPYNAAMSKEYRGDAMKLFRAGIIRVLICTDAAGMGCNIPDIDIVIQWKAPATLSAWVQRQGRAARGIEKGIAVLIAEKSAFGSSGSEQLEAVNPIGRGTHLHGRVRGGLRNRGGRQGGTGGGQRKLSSHAATSTQAPNEPPTAEGLYDYIQTTQCRRRLLGDVFGNDPPNVPQEACCDVCAPSLRNQVQAPKPVKTTARRSQGIKKGPLNASLFTALIVWRNKMKTKHYSNHPFGAYALFDNDLCKQVASLKACPSLQQVAQLLLRRWSFFDKLGEELADFLASNWKIHSANTPESLTAPLVRSESIPHNTEAVCPPATTAGARSAVLATPVIGQTYSPTSFDPVAATTPATTVMSPSAPPLPNNFRNPLPIQPMLVPFPSPYATTTSGMIYPFSNYAASYQGGSFQAPDPRIPLRWPANGNSAWSAYPSLASATALPYPPMYYMQTPHQQIPPGYLQHQAPVVSSQHGRKRASDDASLDSSKRARTGGSAL